MSNPVGNPNFFIDPIREAWMLRFCMTKRQAMELSEAMMAQLSYCTSDEARRIILGISK